MKNTESKITMKTKQVLPTISLALVLSLILLPSAFGQGSLTPPGAPAPTMKTLTQVEPRTPITAVPYTITNPGSYYLTTNFTVSSGHAITIATNGVTLDLNGFTLKSTDAANTGDAVFLYSGLRNLTILNGFIEGGVTNNGSGVYSGPGFAYGIYSPSIDPVNTRVSGVSVTGCKNSGIWVSYGISTVVENCTVRTVGGIGIYGDVIKGCSATDCGGFGIEGYQVSDSHGESTTSGDGIYATTAQNCYGSSGSGPGLYATHTAQNCYGSSGSDTGLYAATAQNCYGFSSSGTGLNATVANNCIGYRPGGTAILATVANGCYATSGTNNITYKYNMP